MAEITSFDAQPRLEAGKGAARAARRNGYVPGIIYGDNKDPVPINMDPRALWRELNKGGFHIRQFNVKINGEEHRVMARDVQFHPVTNVPMHIDFLRVTGKTKITVEIPVVYVGEEESPGLSRGGVLNVVRHTIEVNTTVDNIPETFSFDLSELDIGGSVHISDTEIPDGVHVTITDRDFTVATVAAPTVVRDEAAAEAVEEEDGLEGVARVEGEGVEGEAAAEGEEAAEAGGEESKKE